MAKETDGALVAVETLPAAAELFRPGGVDAVIELIREQVIGHVPVLDTAAGRKAIASRAYKVAQSKVVIDNLGKELVADLKKECAKVDAERKRARDTLDALRDEVRRPLDEYEAEQARIEAERLAEEQRARDEAAAAEAARVAELERREAELAAREQALTTREQAEALAQQQLIREAQIREEAAEAERLLIARRQEDERLEAARRAADVEHRRAVNVAARDGLADCCSIDSSLATRIIQAIAAGKVPAVSITY